MPKLKSPPTRPHQPSPARFSPARPGSQDPGGPGERRQAPEARRCPQQQRCAALRRARERSPAGAAGPCWRRRRALRTEGSRQSGWRGGRGRRRLSRAAPASWQMQRAPRGLGNPGGSPCARPLASAEELLSSPGMSPKGPVRRSPFPFSVRGIGYVDLQGPGCGAKSSRAERGRTRVQKGEGGWGCSCLAEASRETSVVSSSTFFCLK